MYLAQSLKLRPMGLAAEDYAELLEEASLVVNQLGVFSWAQCSTMEMFCRKSRRGGCLLREDGPGLWPHTCLDIEN